MCNKLPLEWRKFNTDYWIWIINNNIKKIKPLNWGTVNGGSTAHSISLNFQVIGTTLHILQWTLIRLYSLFKSERLSTNIKLTLHKALIRSLLTSACPTWEFVTETHLLKLQHLQNKVFHTIGNLPRCTSVRDMHVAFQIPYVYNYITKLCRRQAEIIHNHENENVRSIGQGKTPHRKHKLGGGQLYNCSSV
jgi:hypothetical protein